MADEAARQAFPAICRAGCRRLRLSRRQIQEAGAVLFRLVPRDEQRRPFPAVALHGVRTPGWEDADVFRACVFRSVYSGFSLLHRPRGRKARKQSAMERKNATAAALRRP